MKLLILGLCLAATVTGKQGLFFGAKRDFVVPSRPQQASEVEQPAAATSDQQQLKNFPQSRGPVAAPVQDDRQKVLKGLQQQEQELHNLLAQGIERKLDEHDSHVSRGQQGSGLQRSPKPAIRGSEPSTQAAGAPRRIKLLHSGMLKKTVVPVQSTVRQSPKLDDISRQIDELLKERARLSAQANSIIKTSAKPGSSSPVKESFTVTTPAYTAAPAPTPRPAPAIRAPISRLAPAAPKPSQRRVSALPPSRKRFKSFEALPSGSVRTIQSNAPRTVSIEVSGVAVPKFSKMVSNRGLNLLTRDETIIPVEKMEEVVAAAPPAPAIKGFRVKGDSTNRVIFLNVAALGLQEGSGGLLRLGDMELIPIEEHTRLDNTVEPDTNAYISRDALSKMVNTHIMHKHKIHQRVSLPTFQSDRRLADQLPARYRQEQNVPVFRAQQQELRPVVQQQQSAPIQTRQQQRPVNRKSPIFFSRFGGLNEAGVDVSDARPVIRQQPQGEKSNARELQNVANKQQTQRQRGFSSFPQTSRGQTPSRQRQPAPQKLPRAPKQLGEFDVYLKQDDVNEQQSRFSSFQQQSNSLSTQPTRRIQQQEPINRVQQETSFIQQQEPINRVQQQQTNFIQQQEPINRFQEQPNNRIQQQQPRQQQNSFIQHQEPINRFQAQQNFDSFQQQSNNRFQQPQQQNNFDSNQQQQQPDNRYHQQQQPVNRYQQQQQQPDNRYQQQQQQPDNRYQQQQQQPDNRFQQQQQQPDNRFQQPQQRQQDNRNNFNFQNEPAQLDPRIQAQIDQQQKAPGVESVLRQQEELRALNKEHSDWNDKLNRENNYLPQQQTRQQQQPRFSTRLDQPQQYQPEQRQDVPQFQPQQQQYQPEQQQPDQRHQNGLEQHARFVQELTAAQNALSSLS